MSAIRTDRPRFHAPRRLASVIFLVAAIVAALTIVPGLASFAPRKEIAETTLSIDYFTFKPGEYREYVTEGAIRVAVYRRTPEQVHSLASSHSIRYPAALVDHDLPDGIDPSTRSGHAEYFVFYPIGTRWGCPFLVQVPNENKASPAGWDGGFFEYCHMDYAYDYAGWSLERPNSKSEYMWLPSRNLIVPRHKYSDGKLIVQPSRVDLKRKIGSVD